MRKSAVGELALKFCANFANKFDQKRPSKATYINDDGRAIVTRKSFLIMLRTPDFYGKIVSKTIFDQLKQFEIQ